MKEPQNLKNGKFCIFVHLEKKYSEFVLKEA